MILKILIEIMLVTTFVAGIICKRRAAGFLLILGCVAVCAAIVYWGRHSVTRVDMPSGELSWSTEYPQDALLCVPAAYSDEAGNIIGQYILEGKVHNSLKKYTGRTSIKDNLFYVDYKWLSDEGFQQHTLVMDGVPKTFVDNRYKIRRALCKRDGKVFLLQSNFPVTMNSFARICAKHTSNAVNLDMGHCGYGFYKWHGITIPLAGWTYFTRDAQTNWLYISR